MKFHLPSGRRFLAAMIAGVLALSGLVSIQAVNATSAQAAVLNLDAPVITSVSASVANQLTVNFSAPQNSSGLTITSYQVEYSTDGSTWSVASSSVSPVASSYTITGLAANTSYYVRMAAYAGGLGSYGYDWKKIYSTSNQNRNSNQSIIYDSGFGLGAGDAAVTYANSGYTRVRYLMKATYGGQNNYVDADFSKNMSSLASGSESFTTASNLAYLRIPGYDGVAANQFEIQGDVSDLTVLSNVAGVENGSGYSGRLEIWPWNYDINPTAGLSSTRSSAIYDDGDSINTNGGFGSFQLHRLSTDAAKRKTIFAWNYHLYGVTAEIGFGDNSLNVHTDWTFSSQSVSYVTRTGFSLGVYINAPTTTMAISNQAALTVSTTSAQYGSAYTLSTSGGSGTGAVTYAVANGTATGCQVSGASLTFTSAGTCLVTATKAASSGYYAISSSQTTVTISGKSVTVTAATRSISYGGTFTNSYTAGSLAGSDAISSVTYTYRGTGATTYGPSTTAPTAVGTYSITPAVTALSVGTLSNYAFTYTAGTLTIGLIALSEPGSISSSTTAGVLKSIDVWWPDVANATSYTVKFSTGGVDVFTVDSVSSTVTVADARFANGTAYSISVRANGTGNYASSAFSSSTAMSFTNGIYTLTYVYNGATGGNATASDSYITNGTAITLPVPTRTGYGFGGWYEEPGFINQVTGPQTPWASANLYAKWLGNTYTLTYVYNGATGGNTTASANYTSGGTAITLPVPTRTGYSFAGWYAEPGFTTTVTGSQTPSASASLYAKWLGNTYTLTYVYNGATGGNSVVSDSYTSGNPAITLPTPTRSNYLFGGWYSDAGLTSAVSSTQSPTASATLYAKWTVSHYALTLQPNWGVSVSSVVSVPVTTVTVLPTPVRANFVFDGWYTSAIGGTKVANGGANYTPTQDTALYAHWIQSSLYGIAPGNLTRVGTLTANDAMSTSFNGTLGANAVNVALPNAALPAGTVVALDLITDTSYAQSLLTGSNTYLLSLAVSWLAPDQTVPETNSGKSIAMQISNPAIKAGALIYGIQNGVAVLLGTATVDGSISIQLTSDPGVYLVSTVPSVAQTINAVATETSAVITWAIPASNGGSVITGYTVTLSNGQTCTTTLLTCTFSNLTPGTAYVATVVATNSVGNSIAATRSFSSASPVVVPPVVVPPVKPEEPQKPVDPVTPVTPSKPVVTQVSVTNNVAKVQANNVPVLNGDKISSPILFAPNASALTAGALKQIKIIATSYGMKNGTILVTGFVRYTNVGAAKMKKIAFMRAQAVSMQLAKLGIKANVGFVGYGPHNTKSPSASDRKVELRWVANR